jgi:hypothetical protein
MVESKDFCDDLSESFTWETELKPVKINKQSGSNNFIKNGVQKTRINVTKRL